MLCPIWPCLHWFMESRLSSMVLYDVFFHFPAFIYPWKADKQKDDMSEDVENNTNKRKTLLTYYILISERFASLTNAVMWLNWRAKTFTPYFLHCLWAHISITACSVAFNTQTLIQNWTCSRIVKWKMSPLLSRAIELTWEETDLMRICLRWIKMSLTPNQGKAIIKDR